MTVLIFATDPEADPCVRSVRQAIVDRGGEVACLATGRFPTHLPLSLRVDADGVGALHTGEGIFRRDQVSGAWIRHTDVGEQLPEEMREDHLLACRTESEAAIWNVIECLDVYLLDPPAALHGCPGKLGQAALARRVGLDVPRTLLTNDADAVRTFAAECPGGVVYKMVDSAVGTAGDDTSSGDPIFTRRLTDEDLASMAGLDLCPMLFQEAVPKDLELRLTVVGERLFCAAVDPKGVETVDFRRDKQLVASFFAHSLPDEVAGKVFALLDRVGLDFATLDMIVTPDGRHVLLEVNTVAYFDFVERATDLPISGAVADLLLGRVPSRFADRRGSV